MRIFTCPTCSEALFFENSACACGTEVAYDPDRAAFVEQFAPCANRDRIRCNWIAEGEGTLCRACAMTEVIPDIATPANVALWADAELAKRWVLANLTRWGWFTAADDGRRPTFRLLSEQTSAGEAPVTMGHADGVVTINVTEADPAERVRRRIELGEPLRTMIGHFRHEIGHFFFQRLSERPDFLHAFRALFGDERADYGAALQRHYADGAPAGWRETYISAYSSAHPHEDWAECFAHLLHLADIVDSFVAAGLRWDAAPAAAYDPYAERDGGRLITFGAELGIALNHVNRSMGLADIYPFVLTASIRAKLAFVHDEMQAARPQADAAGAGSTDTA
jgi:hypothetical protein